MTWIRIEISAPGIVSACTMSRGMSHAALSAPTMSVRGQQYVLFRITISVGCSIFRAGSPRPETLHVCPPHSNVSVSLPNRIASRAGGARSKKPLSAPTATIQSPAGVSRASLVISIVVLCSAITFLCPCAVMSISIKVSVERIPYKIFLLFRPWC